MEKVLKSGRIDYAKPYDIGGRMDKCLDDRSKYIKQKHNHTSTYMQDYDHKTSKLDLSVLSGRKLLRDGYAARLLFDHKNYMNNMSTLKDLSYNHFPKWSGNEPLHRYWRFRMERWEPVQDCCKNFGNLTTYGITECKKQTWKDSLMDTGCPSRTDYQDMFQPPPRENYKFKRWAIPRTNSSILNKLNFESIHLRYRNKEINAVSPNDVLVLVPREDRCNPITWECADDNVNVGRRCVPEKVD